MGATPDIIGCQCDDTEDAADPIACCPIFEERAVAAIVLDCEEAQQEHGDWHGESQCEPVTHRERYPCCCPKSKEGDGCDQKFKIAARGIGLAEFGEGGDPFFGGFDCFGLLGREGGCDVHTSLS